MLAAKKVKDIDLLFWQKHKILRPTNTLSFTHSVSLYAFYAFYLCSCHIRCCGFGRYENTQSKCDWSSSRKKKNVKQSKILQCSEVMGKVTSTLTPWLLFLSTGTERKWCKNSTQIFKRVRERLSRPRTRTKKEKKWVSKHSVGWWKSHTRDCQCVRGERWDNRRWGGYNSLLYFDWITCVVGQYEFWKVSGACSVKCYTKSNVPDISVVVFFIFVVVAVIRPMLCN